MSDGFAVDWSLRGVEGVWLMSEYDVAFGTIIVVTVVPLLILEVQFVEDVTCDDQSLSEW